ncbi:MAG: helix-turn-helix transcriptional regulator [Anaerocolumna sp.]
MQNKAKELRKNRHLTQVELGELIGVTQQNYSRYEKDITIMPIDILIKISEYYNVTTDYLLGISEVKRGLEQQISINKTLDEYYDFIEVYRTLKDEEKELIWTIVEKMRQLRIRKG